MAIVAGRKQAEKAFRAIRDSVQEETLERAISAASEIVEKSARSKAPVRRGVLRRSIRKETVRRQNKIVETRVGPGKEGFYGSFLEFGTRRMPARPWLRPAFEESKKEAEDAAADVLGDEVTRVAIRFRR